MTELLVNNYMKNKHTGVSLNPSNNRRKQHNHRNSDTFYECAPTVGTVGTNSTNSSNSSDSSDSSVGTTIADVQPGEIS